MGTREGLSPRAGKPALHFHCATGLFVSPKDSRAHVALLGPCFKTGQMKPPTANSLKRSRDACAGRRETSLSHYRSSPRGRPLARRRLSCHEGLRRWVERPSPRSPTRSERQAVRS